MLNIPFSNRLTEHERLYVADSSTPDRPVELLQYMPSRLDISFGLKIRNPSDRRISTPALSLHELVNGVAVLAYARDGVVERRSDSKKAQDVNNERVNRKLYFARNAFNLNRRFC